MSQNVFAQNGVSDAVYRFGEEVLAALRPRFDEIDRTAEYNQAKVIAAMQKNRVDVACFAGTTGYGYNDVVRKKQMLLYMITGMELGKKVFMIRRCMIVL